MKYTDYIMNADIDLNSMVPKNQIARIIMLPMAITVAMSGVVILTSVLPFTFLMDTVRAAKLEMYHLSKLKKKDEEIDNILSSFSASPEKMKEFKKAITDVNYQIHE